MKKKAFTLTELLVVVVIIGVLSAVVLPKFTKMLETRKTTEAEEMMTAVRNEQDARCTISKNYKKDISQLASYQAGKNFDYADLDGVGMIATAKSGKYSLRMPSYADGRICCDDEYCQEELNKNYPRCNELENFVEGNADCSAGWQDEGEESSCDLASQEPCEPPYVSGMRYYEVDKGTCTRKEVSNTCKEPESCTKKPYREECPNDKSHFIYYTVNEEKCEYDKDDSACNSCDKKDYQVLCPQDSEHYIYYTVNNKCEYDIDNSQCKGCPTVCESEYEYVNTNCMCVPCLKENNVRVNAERNNCEATITPLDCAREGKVYMRRIVENQRGAYALCFDCRMFGRKGPSGNGTLDTCQEDLPECPLTPEYCASQGAQLVTFDKNGVPLFSDCYCNPCPKGLDEDGVSCACVSTLQDCAAQGLVFSDQRKYGGNCECLPCSRYYKGEGTTPTGYHKDCNNCPK